MNEVATPGARRHEKYERLIARRARAAGRSHRAVAHPCDESSLGGAIEAARLGLILPILVGPRAQDRAPSAQAAGLDIAAFELVDVAAQPRRRRRRRSSWCARAGPRR